MEENVIFQRDYDYEEIMRDYEDTFYFKQNSMILVYIYSYFKKLYLTYLEYPLFLTE